MEDCLIWILVIVLIITLCYIFNINDTNDTNDTNDYFDGDVTSDNGDEKLDTNYLKYYEKVTGLISAQPRHNIVKPYYEPTYNKKMDDAMDFSLNLCSPNCCKSQSPSGFVGDLYTYDNNKFVSSNYSCNNSFQNSGCLCMTKNQASLLGSRGNNA